MNVKSRILLLIFLISLLSTSLLGCSKSQNLYNKMETVKSKETALNADNQNTTHNANKKDTTNTNDKLVKESKEYFSPEDIYINNKPILDISYKQLIQDFGKPLKQEIYEVSLPASEEIEYLYVCVYEGFTCEFYPKEEKCDLNETDSVFRFDITSDSVGLDCGLTIGMSIDEIEEIYSVRTIYSLDKEKEDSDFDYIMDELNGYKPKDYYSGYNEAVIVYHDVDKFDALLAKALFLLINHGRLDRIVFNYPTAG